MATTTTLVHRNDPTPTQWWRDGLVYEIAQPAINAHDLDAIDQLLPHIADLGMTTVLIRPSEVDVETDPTAMAEFIDHAHDMGLRVVVRISGAVSPLTHRATDGPIPCVTGLEREGEDLLTRAEAFLACGADGLDLGTIVPPQVQPSTNLDVLSSRVTILQSLLAEYADEGIIGADASSDFPDALQHHIEDDWLHHLRDDSLVRMSWSAASITDQLTHSFAIHDRFGALPVWRILPSYALVGDQISEHGSRWFEADEATRLRRSRALQLMALSLPGTVYVRQGDETGLLDRERPTDAHDFVRVILDRSQEQESTGNSPLANCRGAAILRQEWSLPGAPMAFVQGLQWSSPEVLTFLSRNILVVVNTSSGDITLPAGANVVASSHPLKRHGEHRVVPPLTCVWLEASTVS